MPRHLTVDSQGVPGGLATLGEDGKVPSFQLPAAAVPAYASAPAPGGFPEGSLIYVVSGNALQLLYQGAWITLGSGGSPPGAGDATYDVSFYDTDYYA